MHFDDITLASILREQALQLFRDGIRFRLLCLIVEARSERFTVSIFPEHDIEADPK